MKKNTSQEKFSVLMSIYNKENPIYLDKCLESVLIEQSVIPNEIVMIKDGPLTEELESVLNKYDKQFPKVFKFIIFDKNMGLGYTLHKGIEKCSYNIVMRMDTDDICDFKRFEKQLEFMRKNKDISVVGSFISEFEEDPKNPVRIKNMPVTQKEILKYAKFRNPLNHMTVCLRKNDILKIGNYQPLPYMEDYYLWIRLLVNGFKIANIPDICVYARIGNGFNKRRGNKKQIESWKTLQKYMYENKFINIFQKYRNILCMYLLVYTFDDVRGLIYNKFLRK